MNIIEITQLHKSYGSGNAEAIALDGVDLTVEEGAYCVLEGRSGSGKSTLLNCIGALDSPTSGTIVVANQNYAALTEEQRSAFRLRWIGFVFQAYNLLTILNARENVAYLLQLQGMNTKVAMERADHWLERVGLAEQRYRLPNQLSGGQQQRVAVARALASKPALVLADEPTANLDSATAQGLVDLMLELNQESGITLLVSSHDPVVINSAKQLIRMVDGRVVG